MFSVYFQTSITEDHSLRCPPTNAKQWPTALEEDASIELNLRLIVGFIIITIGHVFQKLFHLLYLLQAKI